MADGRTRDSDRGDGARAPFLSAGLPTFYRVFGNMGWPILLKQLRINFRRNRFFVAHFVSLFLLSCLLIVTIATLTSNPNVTPSQVGESVFGTVLHCEILVVLLLFPVFGSTAFSEERANLSFDFLLISRLKPREIVWGKFLSTSLYCLMFLLASIPLLSISFLFGGLHVGDVVHAYVVLLSLTALISIFGLWVSSYCRSSVRSTLVVYSVLLLTSLIAWFFYVSGLLELLDEAGGGNLLSARQAYLRSYVTDTSLQATTTIVDGVAVFSYLFLFTTNRVRPLTSDRSSHVRLLTIVYVPLRFFLSFASNFEGIFDVNFSVAESYVRDVMEREVLVGACLLLVTALLFSTEDALVSRRVCDKVQGWGRKGALLRFLAPGPFSGFLFSTLLSIVACSVLYWVFFGCFAGNVGQIFEFTVHQALVTLPLYVAAFAGLGFLLSVLNFTPLYSRLTLVFVLIITVLLPMIFYLVELPDRPYYFYYLSPIILWKSLDPSVLTASPVAEEAITHALWGVPIITIAKLVFGAATIVFVGAGIWVARGSGMTLWSYRHIEREIGLDDLETGENSPAEA